MKNKEYTYTRIALAVLMTIVFSYLAWVLALEDLSNFDKAGNDFCKERGFKEMTDYTQDSCGWGYSETIIECDKDKTFDVTIGYEYSYDKWGKEVSRTPSYLELSYKNWSCR